MPSTKRNPATAAWNAAFLAGALLAGSLPALQAGEPATQLAEAEKKAVGALQTYALAQATVFELKKEFARSFTLLDEVLKPPGASPIVLVDAGFAKAAAPDKALDGYYFVDIKSAGGKELDPAKEFALCAVPAAYGRTGRQVFIMGKDGVIYGKDCGESRPLADFPADPGKDGWAPRNTWVRFFYMARVRDSAKSVQSKSNLHQIGLACHLWADDHDEVFPPDLLALFPQYLDNKKLLACPQSEQHAASGVDYAYVAGLRAADPPGTILAFELEAGAGGKVNVLYADAHVLAVGRDELNKSLAEQMARMAKDKRAVKLVTPAGQDQAAAGGERFAAEDQPYPCQIISRDDKSVTVLRADSAKPTTIEWSKLTEENQKRLKAAKLLPADPKSPEK